MSIWSKVAIGLWEKDCHGELLEQLMDLNPDIIQKVQTPDEAYKVFYWDYVEWETEKSNKMLEKIEVIRHSYIQISEDGEIFTDMEPSDSRGTDEEFYELLGCNANIFIWGDERIDKPPVRNTRPAQLLRDLAKNELKTRSRADVLRMFTEAGLFPQEIKDYGLEFLDKQEEAPEGTAEVTMHVEGYVTIDVPDGTVDDCLKRGNEIVDEMDFGPLSDIEWQVSSIEHADGSRKEFR